jgi:enamine deaminase RidA (YjgF/YER057c/UK114 family)
MQLINPNALGSPKGYSHGVLTPDGLLFVAGQIGWDGGGRVVSEHLPEQFDRALANVLTVVEHARGRADSIVRMTIYVTDKEEYNAQRREIGERYRGRMGRHYPAMTLVEVQDLLEPRARIEIEATAWIGRP